MTFEDISQMHYSKLKVGTQLNQYFDPKQLFDIDSDDENHEILKNHLSPSRNRNYSLNRKFPRTIENVAISNTILDKNLAVFND